ncbi:uncharacterized protein LOC121417479 [Lytechinus variegatus]|uniref:uncharacterized protein LOC121417479 n=1 Tax=Lytechinus variegatus TaxID=7654 RepID=UPI001BB21686|nr:uncharacterized protein LOC121417479 [Lytechinus variegatus]
MATVKLDWMLLTLLLVHCGDNFVNGIITDVRLDGGPSPDKGTVQIMQDNGIWETTCGINLDINDVIVICKQLGYTGANRAIQSTPYGHDSTSPNMSKIGLSCNGGEDDLAECPIFQQQCWPFTGAASCHGVNYLGCYVDRLNDRVFPGDSLLSDADMTISYCIQFCNDITSSIYEYAGVNNGNECYCGAAGDNYTRHGVASDRECQSPCQGDSTESCGGVGYIAVFRINIGTILSTEKVQERSTKSALITNQPTSEMTSDPNNDSPTATTLSSILLQTGSNSCIGVGIGEGVVIILLVVIVIALVLNNLRMRKMMKDSNSDQKTQPLDVVRSSGPTDKDTGFYHDIQDFRESTVSPSPDGEVQYSSKIYEQKRDSALYPNDSIQLQHSYMM